MFPLFGAISFAAVPVWPQRYTLKGTWQLPRNNIRQRIEVQSDFSPDNKRQILITNGGTQRIFNNMSQSYTIEPAFDKESCLYQENDGKFFIFLPDLTTYQKVTDRVIDGKLLEVYQQNDEADPGHKYWRKFYLDPITKEPKRFEMWGISIRSSHAAHYVYDIDEYSPFVDERAFLLPMGCKEVPSDGPTYNEQENSDFIPLEVRHPKVQGNSDKCSLIPPLPNTINVPESFSWRQFGTVVGPLRDQASCGSCWAQCSASALSSQLSMMLGKVVTTSVQQINDCTWGGINYGCMGGETDEAYRIMADKRIRIALEEDYPYIGIGGRCGNVQKTFGIVTDCYQLSDRSYSDDDLKRAIYTYGPIAVSIATKPSFSYYHSGVYTETQCTDEATLTHGVLLTGWKMLEGKLTWEVQNSWGDIWGEEGYVYIDAQYNCGIKRRTFVPAVQYEMAP